MTQREAHSTSTDLKRIVRAMDVLAEETIADAEYYNWNDDKKSSIPNWQFFSIP